MSLLVPPGLSHSQLTLLPRCRYPWFLSTWDNYPYNIQRADAIRYFVLLHYGGIYIDLDDVRSPVEYDQTCNFSLVHTNMLTVSAQGCQRSLDPLLQFPAWLRRAKPTGISNDVMGAVPNHPFFLRAVQSLQYYDRTWFLPYITVMGSTGPLFLSIIWRHYNTQTPSPTGLGRIRIMFPDEYMFTPWSFFIHNPGSSWHQGDARLIMWLRDNWFLITLSSTSVGLLVVYLVWALVTRFFSSSPSPAPSPTIRHARPNRVPTWLYGRLGYEPIIRRDV